MVTPRKVGLKKQKKKGIKRKAKEMKEVEEEIVIDEEEKIEVEEEEEAAENVPMETEDNNTEEEAENPEEKQRKSGVLYFPMIPPKFNVKRMREYFEELAPGQIGRIYLEKNKKSRSAENRYSEGWIEIKKKKTAKMIASQIDNTLIGGKKKDYVSSMLWNIRYLSGFKWVHLTEQLQFEKQVEKRRMNVEIAQARRVASHFEDQIEKGKHLKKLEAKVKSEGGEWSKFERSVEQKKGKSKKSEKKPTNTDNNELMNMIFS